MKRLVLGIILISSILLAQGAPIKVQTQRAYNSVYGYYYPKIIITSIEDKVTIKNVKVNKGNCKYTNTDIVYRNGRMQTIPLLPRTLKYGQHIEIRLQSSCNLLRVDIETDKNTWTVEY